mgnify:CR=1 FL=1
MKRVLLPLVGVAMLAVFHVVLYGQTFERKNGLDEQARVNYVLPASFSRAAALDFKGVIADFQLLQGIFFIGEKIETQSQVSEAEWDYLVRIITTVTRLDPYFYDTYHFSTGMLTWGAGRYEDAIKILETARQYNPDDYRFPYHIGFIYFYFLQNNQKGAQYLELASRQPDAPPILASLASRLAYYKGNYQFSIDLIQRMMARERSPEIRSYYQKRLTALENALLLEKAVKRYKEELQSLPKSINALLKQNYIDKIPHEPYGGDWIILENGRVYSTSKFANASKKQGESKKDAESAK